MNLNFIYILKVYNLYKLIKNIIMHIYNENNKLVTSDKYYFDFIIYLLDTFP